ncbi:hypothetical protein R1flu_029012 [Riccia fluitans]|uniref:Bulb-type lectin domain-containing protein n=1 Tax=Riccia fluitans TaxID=41844 RepID=A0ABD1XNU3_9MARC
MVCSTAMLVIGLLICTFVLCSSENVLPQHEKFVLKFRRGGMVCTNEQSGLTCTSPRAHHDQGTVSSHRNIFSSERDGDYALGFERASDDSWFLSIYAYHPSNGTAGSSIWRASSVDGSEVQVPSNSSLVFLQSGNLELRGSEGGLQWTPNTWGLGVTELVFFFRGSSKSAGGNLILFDSANQLVWQSMRPLKTNELRLGMASRSDIVCTSGESSGMDCNPALEFPMNPSRGTGNHRNVISYNGDGKYALGIERLADTATFFLSIYIWNQSSGTATGPSIWRASHGRSSIPVAVDEHAIVAFRRNGAFELRDHSNKLLWTTGQTGASELGFNFDTGDLFLYNREGSIIWRSGGEASLQYVALFVSPTTEYPVPKLNPGSRALAMA